MGRVIALMCMVALLYAWGVPATFAASVPREPVLEADSIVVVELAHGDSLYQQHLAFLQRFSRLMPDNRRPERESERSQYLRSIQLANHRVVRWVKAQHLAPNESGTVWIAATLPSGTMQWYEVDVRWGVNDSERVRRTSPFDQPDHK